MAEVFQKLDREGAGARLAFIQDGRTDGFARGPWPAPGQNTQSLAEHVQMALWVA